MVLLLWNVDKYEFLTNGNVLPDEGLVEKATKYEHFQLGSELKKLNWYRKKAIFRIKQGLST